MVSKGVCFAEFVFELLSVISIEMTTSVFGAKILFIPVNVHSHVLYFSRLAADLAELGHVTKVVAPSNARVPHFISATEVNFNYITYEVDGVEPFSSSRQVAEDRLRYALSSSVWKGYMLETNTKTDVDDHYEADCISLLGNDHVMQQVRLGDYQFAVLDWLAAHCYCTIPFSLGIPYGILSTSYYAWWYRVPRLPSFSSSLGYTDRMTFGQRLKTFILDIIQSTQLAQRLATCVDRLTHDRLFLDVVQSASLWFFLEHVAVGYAQPQMPNTVAVGDIMAGRPRKPLPRELEEFMSASKDGVIAVSFGSNHDVLPQNIVGKLCDAFCDRRNRLCVVWKTDNTRMCRCDDERIRLIPWIPQNDMLADPRVQMFINHGGFNSIVESVYHAKPLIIFPIFGDQPTNAGAADYKGYAIRMNIAHFSSESLLSVINVMLSDPFYKRRAQLSSAILRDRSDTPAQRVSAMIDHVIKYGDRHLRTAAFELSTLQLIMFDIFAVLVAAAVVILVVAILVCYCVCRTCYGFRCTRNKSKAE